MPYYSIRRYSMCSKSCTRIDHTLFSTPIVWMLGCPVCKGAIRWTYAQYHDPYFPK